MDARVKAILTELGDDFRSLYGDRLVRLVLFGSHARGDAVPGSDIDVLVVLRGPVEPSLEIERTGRSKAKLCLEYDEVVSTTFVSAERYEAERSPLLLNVRNEGVVV